MSNTRGLAEGIQRQIPDVVGGQVVGRFETDLRDLALQRQIARQTETDADDPARFRLRLLLLLADAADAADARCAG